MFALVFGLGWCKQREDICLMRRCGLRAGVMIRGVGYINNLVWVVILLCVLCYGWVGGIGSREKGDSVK